MTRLFTRGHHRNAFVNDSQERPETCKQAEEKIQVGMVPTHVQLPLDSRRQRAVKTGSAETPQRGLASWQRQRNCAALPVAC
jgi:hypothetical protein